MSRFIRNKDDFKVNGLELFKKICTMKIQVIMIRMDNAGENKLLQKDLKQEEFDISFSTQQLVHLSRTVVLNKNLQLCMENCAQR